MIWEKTLFTDEVNLIRYLTNYATFEDFVGPQRQNYTVIVKLAKLLDAYEGRHDSIRSNPEICPFCKRDLELPRG